MFHQKQQRQLRRDDKRVQIQETVGIQREVFLVLCTERQRMQRETHANELCLT